MLPRVGVISLAALAGALAGFRGNIIGAASCENRRDPRKDGLYDPKR